MMERYKGREEQLMESLVKKYGETSVERRALHRRESLRIALEVAQAEERERLEEAERKAKEREEAPYFGEVVLNEVDSSRESYPKSGRVVVLDDLVTSDEQKSPGGRVIVLDDLVAAEADQMSPPKDEATEGFDERSRRAQEDADLLSSCKPVLILSVLGSRDLPRTKANALHVELHIGRTAYLSNSRAVWRTPTQKLRTGLVPGLCDLSPRWDAHAVMPGSVQRWQNHTLVLKLVSGKAIIAECAIKLTSTISTMPPRYHVLLPTAPALKRAADMTSCTFSFEEESIHRPNDVFDTPKGTLFQETVPNAAGSPGAERLGALLVGISVLEPSVSMESNGHESLVQDLRRQLDSLRESHDAVQGAIDLHPKSLAEANRAGVKNTE